jgi:hypothetical protein
MPQKPDPEVVRFYLDTANPRAPTRSSSLVGRSPKSVGATASRFGGSESRKSKDICFSDVTGLDMYRVR